jgi:hypothetical protein
MSCLACLHSSLCRRGTLPPSLSLLSSLQTLNVSTNSLTGTLPVWLGAMPAVRSADFSHNQFTGGVPDAWCDRRPVGDNYVISHNPGLQGPQVPETLTRRVEDLSWPLSCICHPRSCDPLDLACCFVCQ